MFRSSFSVTSEKVISEREVSSRSKSRKDKCILNARRLSDQPPAFEETHPQVSITKDSKKTWEMYEDGIRKLRSDPATSISYFQKQYFRSRKTNDNLAMHLAWSGVVESILFEGKDYRSLDFWIDQYDAIAKFSGDVDLAASILTKASLFNSLVLRRPDDPILPKFADKIAKGLQVWNDLIQVPLLANRLMRYYVWTGNVESAAIIAGIVRHRLERNDYDPDSTACLYASIAMYSWFNGNPEDCYDGIKKGLAVTRRSGDAEWVYQLNIHGAYAALYERNTDKLEYFLKNINSMDFHGGRIDHCHYHLLATWAAVLGNKFNLAFEHGNAGVALARELGAPLLEGFCHLGVMQMHLEEDKEIFQIDQQRLQNMAARSGSQLLQHLVTLVDTQVFLRQGKIKQAVSKLRGALKFAKKNEHQGLPWWTERSLIHLCEVAIQEGVEKTFVYSLIQKHHLVTTRTDIDDWPYYLKIFTLGRFTVLKQDVPLSFDRKPQRKPLDLLKILIAKGGRDVNVSHICEVMWPDAEGDAAYHSFETTVYRLRKLIGLDQAISIKSGCISLDNRYCWVDTWAFERLHTEIETELARQTKAPKTKELIRLVEKSFSIYHGHFLATHQTDYWSISIRERVKSKFIRQLVAAGQFLESRKEWGHAILCYQKGIELDELIEEFYQHLMVCYGKLGRVAEALVVYRQCKRILFIILGVAPSNETELLLEKIKNKTI